MESIGRCFFSSYNMWKILCSAAVLNVFPTGELLLQGYDLQVAPQLHGIAFEMKETNPLLQQNRVKTKGEFAVLFWDLFNPCRCVFKTQFGTWTPLFFLVWHVFVSVFGGNESHQQENWTQKKKTAQKRRKYCRFGAHLRGNLRHGPTPVRLVRFHVSPKNGA